MGKWNRQQQLIIWTQTVRINSSPCKCMNDLVLQIIAHLHVNKLSFLSHKFPFIKTGTTCMYEICQMHDLCAYTCHLKHLAPGVSPYMKVLWNHKFIHWPSFVPNMFICLCMTIYETNPVRIPVHTSNYHSDILNSDLTWMWWKILKTAFSLQRSASSTVTASFSIYG